MDAIFKMMSAAQKLTAAASVDDTLITPDALRSTMKTVAADLMAVAEKMAPKWGELTGLIRDLEKGK